MSPATKTAISLATPAAAGAPSRVRKQFNTLVKKLEAERVRLRLWRDEAPTLRAVAATELRPLAEAFGAHYRAYLLLLDRAWYDKAIGKKEKDKLSDLICQVAEDLMARSDDDEIKEIYERHSGFGFDPELDEAFMRDLVSAATGIDLGDDADVSSPAALFEAMQKKMAEDVRAREDEQARRPEVKPSARAVRQQAEEAKLKQSVRDIFRKLASALHPDRETDPTERARKTALMQRANGAYAANDLLGLLELQLEVEQIDQRGLDNLADDRIKQYNKILQAQVDEIQIDIMAFETALSHDMGIMPGGHRLPKTIMRDLRTEISALQSDIESISDDLVRFRDIKKLKAWLKTYEIGDRFADFDEPWL